MVIAQSKLNLLINSAFSMLYLSTGFYYFCGGKNMIIHKVLNNNAVIIIDQKGDEQVVCGRGIAFKKRAGDLLPETDTNQVFVLKNKAMNTRFQQVVSETPLEHIQLADEIIEHAKLQLGKRLNESIIVSLSDHIHTSIIRFYENIPLKYAMLWDIKRFYREEFEIGRKALDMIEERLEIRLPEDEAAFIAIHLVNAEMDEDIHNMLEITKLMQEVSNIVKYVFNLEFDEEDIYYYRFITHLKFFAQRIILGTVYEEDDDELLELISLKYKSAFNCVLRISDYFGKKYAYTLTGEEKAYLTIHIHRVVYKNKSKILPTDNKKGVEE